VSGDIPQPSNVDLEGDLIGSILVSNDVYRKVSTIVQADHFAEPAHQQIWSVLAAQIEKGHAATPITLKTYLGDGDFGGITPMAYLARLASASTGARGAQDYARMVRDLYLKRKLIRLGEAIISIAADSPVAATGESLFADVERDLEALRPVVTAEDADFMEFGGISTTEVYDAYQNQRGFVGLSTGLSRLDEVLNGLQNSDLIIIAGRPASGKTSLVTNIGVHVAQHVLAQREAGVRLGPVGFSSLEMNSAQLKQRILADMASVSLQKLLKGRADRDDMEAFMRAEEQFKRLPLMIDATGGLTIAQLKMRARSLKRRHGLSLLIVDYLQLLSGTGKRDNRVSEVTEITMGLKALAKELDVPIIALSQLSRRVEERDDKRPMLSDLRESGSIEQDADSVIFVYREEYYLQQSKPREDGDAMNRWYAQMAKFEGVAEAIVAKNRHGAAGTVELGFEGQFTRFTNEPRFRAPDPNEAREIAQRIVLTSHGKALKEILQELAVNIGRRPNTEELAHKPTLPKGALLIDREEVKRLFVERVVVDLTDTEGRKKLQAAVDNLRNAKLTGNYTNPEKQNFVYLVELIAE
jgi:replicative DNA helicase